MLNGPQLNNIMTATTIKHDNGCKGRKLSPETKEKIRSALLGKKHATARNKGRKHTPETREKMRLAKLGKQYSVKGRKHTLEAIEKMRLSHLGKEYIYPYRGTQHHMAFACEFRSPTNVVWYVKNVRHFVRTHPELFDPEDVIMKKQKSSKYYYCNAASGLGKLTGRTRPRGSWKGWTLVSKVEKEDNKGKDLLDRVLVEDTDDVKYPGQ
jgi:hypothetical protein